MSLRLMELLWLWFVLAVVGCCGWKMHEHFYQPEHRSTGWGFAGMFLGWLVMLGAFVVFSYFT